MAEDTRDSSQSLEHIIALIPSDEAAERDSEEVARKSACPHNDGSKTTNADLSSKRDEIDNSNHHYEGSICVYTDPVTKHQYIWDSNKNEWVVRSDGIVSPEEGSLENSGDHVLKPESEVQNKTNPENVGLLHCPPDYDKTSRNDYEFDGESYCYKDLKTGVTYKFDNSKQSWVVKRHDDSGAGNEECDESDDNVIKQDMSSGTYGYEGDTHTYTDATDGTVYIWDRERNAWFPKVDDDFLAHYQMNYGFNDTSTAASAEKDAGTGDKKETTDEQLGVKRKAGPQDPSWFEMDDQHNTKVYVSNLPLDITDQEFVDVMQKCGLVMKDAETGKMKIKLYTEPASSQLKGDGLCSYIKNNLRAPSNILRETIC